MGRIRKEPAPPLDIPDCPGEWREQIRADLAAQIEAGGTLYGFRADGTWVAQTRAGERVIKRPDRESA